MGESQEPGGTHRKEHPFPAPKIVHVKSSIHEIKYLKRHDVFKNREKECSLLSIPSKDAQIIGMKGKESDSFTSQWNPRPLLHTPPVEHWGSLSWTVNPWWHFSYLSWKSGTCIFVAYWLYIPEFSQPSSSIITYTIRTQRKVKDFAQAP